ncbi:MAG: response regulator transcription factor [Solirubrobacteraceae bacterium]
MTTDPNPVCVLAMTASRLAEGLQGELAVDGYDVRRAESIAEVEARAASRLPDVLIVGTLDDPGAPCALLRGLREGRLAAGRVEPATAAVAIVPDGDLTSLLRAFDCGADDVVAQPVRYAELRARLAALMTRAQGQRVAPIQRIGDLELDMPGRTAIVDGEALELSAKEWDLLACLAAEPTRVFTKQELLRSVWHTDLVGTSRTLDSHACRLRAKLRAAGSSCIENVWGVGYRLTGAKAA